MRSVDNAGMESDAVTPCACGCGELTSPGKQYRSGHNRRTWPPPPAQPCACGCGDLAKPGNRFIRGHHLWKSPVEFIEEDRGYETPCHFWQRALTADGNGHMATKDGTRSARRVVYERERGPIPDGHILEARCKVAACVHPDHMDVITPAEALRRRGIPTPVPRAKRATCKRGHPWTPENTVINAHGRQCRTCLQATHRAYYERKKAAHPDGPPAPPSITDPPDTLRRCRKGHVIAGENASPSGAGRFRCRICVNETTLRRYHQRKEDRERPELTNP